MTYPCPRCKGVGHFGSTSATGELTPDDWCNGTGRVADRRQSQRRKQGRRDGDDLLAEAMELLDEFANIPQLELWHDRIVALREKINE